jgi:hypothetical protein
LGRSEADVSDRVSDFGPNNNWPIMSVVTSIAAFVFELDAACHLLDLARLRAPLAAGGDDGAKLARSNGSRLPPFLG